MLLRLVILAFILSSCADGPHQAASSDAPEHGGPSGSTEDRAEVVAFLESYYAALSDRDWPRFETHFLPEGRLVTVWTPPDSTQSTIMNVTASEFVAAAPDGPDSRSIFDERMVDWEIDARGSLALAWVAYEARFGDPGDILEWKGTDAFSLLRTADGWKIISLAYAADAE